MAKPSVLVLTGYGINCEEETAHAFELSGAKADIIHINDLIENKNKLFNYEILSFPGGFSYGDDTGSGKALAAKIKTSLLDEFKTFTEKDILILGICNGFQVMTNLGIVPGNSDFGTPEVALDHNANNRYECRWVYLKVNSNNLYFKGMDVIKVPVAHGEGNFITSNDVYKKLEDAGQIAAVYSDEDGQSANGQFPLNPNGSMHDVAAITNSDGRFLGMMPHPERNIYFTQRDDWTMLKDEYLREGKNIPEFSDGLKIFQNAVGYFK